MQDSYTIQQSQRKETYPENKGMPNLVFDSMNRRQYHYSVWVSNNLQGLKTFKKNLTLHQAKNMLEYSYISFMSLASWSLPVLGGKKAYDTFMDAFMNPLHPGFQYSESVSNNAFLVSGVTAIALSFLVKQAYDFITTDSKPVLKKEIEEISYRRKDISDRIAELEKP